MLELPDAFVFMKVGMHAGESFESILLRKREEFKKVGFSMWGYGGPTCHPVKHVRPFVRTVQASGGEVHLLMEPIDSRANPQVVPATEFSEDGRIWTPIPDGITVTGSRYALVLDEIKPGELVLPLNEYEVGVGPSEGCVASDYIKGRVDKGCLIRRDVPQDGETRGRKIALTARLLDPYAVFVR
jgi:hypothetical protein